MNYKKVLSGVLAVAICAASTGFQNTERIARINAEEIAENVQAGSNQTDSEFTYRESVTEEGSLGENITYTLYSNGVLKISGTGRMNNFEKSPFNNPEKINAVLFDDGENSSVENIGDYAFSDCVNLYGITIPETVTEIGIHAFSKCKSITEITVPDSVTRVGEYAFENCSGMKKAVLGKGLTKIGTSSAEFYMFDGCFNLEQLSMPSLITRDNSDINSISAEKHSIGQVHELFNDPSRYQSPSIIRLDTFCGNVKKIIVTSGEEIYPYEFSGMDIEEVILPDTITKISKCSFAGCEYLSEIFIPNSVVSIETLAFSYCDSLRKINMGKNIKTIDSLAFNVISADFYPDIYFNGTKTQWNDLSCKPNISYYRVHYLQSEEKTEDDDHTKDDHSKIIEEGVLGEKIDYILYGDGTLKIKGTGKMNDFDESPFKNSDKISNVIFESDDCNVNNIGINTFKDCANLTEITIPETVTSIEKNAFINCKSINELIIPDSVTHIGESAFENCSYMKKAVLGKGLVSIGPNSVEFNIFKGCSGLEELSLPSLVSSPDKIIESGVTTEEIKGGQIYKLFKSDTTFTDNTMDIGYIPTMRLRKITVTSGTEIYPYEFINLNHVTEFILPDTITKISESSFRGCDILKEIRLPESVTEIDDQAFESCSALKTIHIGKNLKKVNKDSFLFCHGIDDVYFSGTEKQWDELKLSSADNIFDNLFTASVHFTSEKTFVKTIGTDITSPQVLEQNRGSGDMDGNGITDLTDLMCLSMYLLKDYDFTTSAKVYSDITNDGEVDIADLAALRMIIMKAK